MEELEWEREQRKRERSVETSLGFPIRRASDTFRSLEPHPSRCTERRKKGEEDGFDGVVYREKKKEGRRRRRRESEREKKSEIKKSNYYFIIKINNILIKLTSLFFVRGGDALVNYCSLGSITVH